MPVSARIVKELFQDLSGAQADKPVSFSSVKLSGTINESIAADASAKGMKLWKDEIARLNAKKTQEKTQVQAAISIWNQMPDGPEKTAAKKPIDKNIKLIRTITSILDYWRIREQVLDMIYSSTIHVPFDDEGRLRSSEERRRNPLREIAGNPLVHISSSPKIRRRRLSAGQTRPRKAILRRTQSARDRKKKSSKQRILPFIHQRRSSPNTSTPKSVKTGNPHSERRSSSRTSSRRRRRSAPNPGEA